MQTHTSFGRKQKKQLTPPTGPKVDAFWDSIEPLGWGTKTTKYDELRMALLKKWTPEQAEEMRDVFNSLRGPLYARCFDEVEGCGDDSYDDLLAHIIGMGREEYARNMEDPSLANKRVQKRQFKESFSYALPLKHDYEMLEPAFYVKCLKRLVAGLNEGLKDDRYEPVHGNIKRIVEVLEAAYANPRDVLDKVDTIMADYQPIVERSEWLYRGSWGIPGNSLTDSCGITNVVQDMKRYLK